MGISSIKNLFTARSTPQQTLENVLVWGTIILFLSLLFIIFWADFVYYQTNLKDRAAPATESPERIIAAEDINETIKLLDKRAAKFQEILQIKN